MKKKALTALLSLLISFGLWLYVITVVEPNSDATYSNIPVVFIGESALEERNLMITDGRDASVTMRLSGNRLDLNKLNNSNINLKVDLSKIYDPGAQRLPYTISYPGNISSGSISEVNRSPDQISLVIEPKLTKPVPVVIAYKGAVPENYIAETDKPVLDYESINLVGPESILNQISKALIEVDLKNCSESISQTYKYTLCNSLNQPVDLRQLVKPDVEEVHLDLKVQKVKEVQLYLKVIDGGGATGLTSSIKIEPEKIKVSGSDAALESLDKLEIGEINLGDLTGDKTMKFPVKMPKGITNLTGLSEVEVSVSFPDLLTKEFKVKNIKTANVPEGMRAEILTKEFTINVRGPASLVRRMTEDDFTAVVDFTDAVPGTARKTVKIEFSEAFSSVGELGSYSVSATLTAHARSIDE